MATLIRASLLGVPRICMLSRPPIYSLTKQDNNLRNVIYRNYSKPNNDQTHTDQNQRKRIGLYMAALAFSMLAASYAAVPLYRIYCQITGKGGKAIKDSEDKIVNLVKNEDRLITVKFNADTSSQMAWKFRPVQTQVKVHPGETTLAFYRAKNPLNEAVIGVATYSVMPYEAGLYFNKIQCFCFEEQMLAPNEDVFMPVLFYIDPKYAEDHRLEGADEIILSYTFFQSKDGGLFMPKNATTNNATTTDDFKDPNEDPNADTAHEKG